jgi:exosortase O
MRYSIRASPDEIAQGAAACGRNVVWLSRAARAGANLMVLGSWLWLFRSVFDYLGVIFSREDFRTNQVMLAGVLILIASRVHKGRFRARIDAAPQLYPPALAFILGSAALYLVVERFLDINTLSASLFGLAGYGLLGLYMQPRGWRAGLPAALLLIGVLPFGEHMQTFVGYPLRLLTATIVRDGLSAAGVQSLGVDTILVLENGVSQIDLPCSGVKSLWTGMLFLLAATWIDRRPLNLGWLLAALVLSVLLFLANLARVGILVVVGAVAGWMLLAEMIHVPLGVLGFVAACGAAVAVLRLGHGGRDVGLYQSGPTPAHLPWLAPGLSLVMLVLGLLYSPRPWSGLTQPPPEREFPAELVSEPLPLTTDQVDWLTRGGAESVDRRRFEWRGISGSMILITSSTWRAQHRPERCFEVYGLSLEDSRTQVVDPDFPLRLVSLSYGAGQGGLSAAYWFQSQNHTTDDYGARVWADLAPRRERWVLVTVLFDGVQDARAADNQALYRALHDGVARGLEGGP